MKPKRGEMGLGWNHDVMTIEYRACRCLIGKPAAGCHDRKVVNAETASRLRARFWLTAARKGLRTAGQLSQRFETPGIRASSGRPLKGFMSCRVHTMRREGCLWARDATVITPIYAMEVQDVDVFESGRVLSWRRSRARLIGA